ncbi:MAG TPA: hypothetical protein PKY56_11690 [Candidatus Kapabacteria bacterium]|nr:hypothetical protein [Candidatus Kapabacteria bacterium]HPO61631.1 hypothetical protein [Candidatus Kapabacteria bacterium]
MLKKIILSVIIFSVLFNACSQKEEEISLVKTYRFKQNPNLIEEKREYNELGFSIGIPKTFTELDSVLFEKYSPIILDLIADSKLKIEPQQIFFSDTLSTLLFISKVFLPDSLDGKEQISFFDRLLDKHFDSFQLSKSQFEQDSVQFEQYIIKSDYMIYFKFLFQTKEKQYNSVDFIMNKKNFNDSTKSFIEAAISSIKMKKN